MSQTPERPLDPETVCTRVVARLIEDIDCVQIAPDSPVWSDLGAEGQRSGELRVYRGRGRVQKVVQSCFTLQDRKVDSHSLVVFTHPESPVPHLMLDAIRKGPRVHLHIDLLPKRDLAVSFSYLDRCYGPLGELRTEIDADVRFVPEPISLRQRTMLSPWCALYTLAPEELGAAETYIERYVSHWANLLRSTAPELSPAPDVARRDALHRRMFFSRSLDPVWNSLDQVIGRESVERILEALAD